MTKKEPFCGFHDPPTGRRRGTEDECREMGQLRYYGKTKVKGTIGDPKSIAKLQRKLGSIMGKLIYLKGRYRRFHDRRESFYADMPGYKKANDELKEVDKEIVAKWNEYDKTVDEYNKLVPKAKKKPYSQRNKDFKKTPDYSKYKYNKTHN